MTPKSSSWRQKHVMTSKTRQDTKKFINASCRQKVRHDDKNTSWRQQVRDVVKNTWKVRHDAKNIVKNCVMMLTTVSPIWNVKYDSCSPFSKKYFATNLTFLRCLVPELSTIMCLSQFRWPWPWPLTYPRDIFFNAGITPGYLQIKFCNNRFTLHEDIVWYRTADMHIHRHTQTHIDRHTDRHNHYNNLAFTRLISNGYYKTRT